MKPFNPKTFAKRYNIPVKVELHTANDLVETTLDLIGYEGDEAQYAINAKYPFNIQGDGEGGIVFIDFSNGPTIYPGMDIAYKGPYNHTEHVAIHSIVYSEEKKGHMVILKDPRFAVQKAISREFYAKTKQQKKKDNENAN